MTRKELKAVRTLLSHVAGISWNEHGQYFNILITFHGTKDKDLIERIFRAHNKYAVNKILKEVSK